jgi:hypothetical protein
MLKQQQQQQEEAGVGVWVTPGSSWLLLCRVV